MEDCSILETGLLGRLIDATRKALSFGQFVRSNIREVGERKRCEHEMRC